MVIFQVSLIILCLVFYALIYIYVVIPLDTSIFITEQSLKKRIWLMLATRIMWVLTSFKIIDCVDLIYNHFVP